MVKLVRDITDASGNMARKVHQIVPLVILFSLGLAGLIVARRLLVPPTFGQYGHYRAAAVDEVAAQEPVYAGSQVCGDCHDDIYEAKRVSNHKGVACEACHGPARDHTEAPDEYTPTAPRGRGFCPLCHGYNPARPSGFPQILPEFHNPGKACMSCHNPHDPVLPKAPEECSACHRKIASQKMVSHHAPLACTTCHVVPKGHWADPRRLRAEKPTSRAKCGECHSLTADSPRQIPRIDMDTHGERYKCWDCHYPHYPEAHD